MSSLYRELDIPDSVAEKVSKDAITHAYNLLCRYNLLPTSYRNVVTFKYDSMTYGNPYYFILSPKRIGQMIASSNKTQKRLGYKQYFSNDVAIYQLVVQFYIGEREFRHDFQNVHYLKTGAGAPYINASTIPKETDQRYGIHEVVLSMPRVAWNGTYNEVEISTIEKLGPNDYRSKYIKTGDAGRLKWNEVNWRNRIPNDTQTVGSRAEKYYHFLSYGLPLQRFSGQFVLYIICNLPY